MISRKVVKTVSIISALIALTGVSSQSLAIPAAQACAGCHGATGKSMNPLWPNLAGQKKEYLKKQLNDFQSGARKDPLMTPMSQNLSSADIDAISEFFSKQK